MPLLTRNVRSHLLKKRPISNQEVPNAHVIEDVPTDAEPLSSSDEELPPTEATDKVISSSPRVDTLIIEEDGVERAKSRKSPPRRSKRKGVSKVPVSPTHISGSQQVQDQATSNLQHSSSPKRKRSPSPSQEPDWMNATQQERAQMYGSQPTKVTRRYGKTTHNIHSNPPATQDMASQESNGQEPKRRQRPKFKNLKSGVLSEKTATNKANFQIPGGSSGALSGSPGSFSSSNSKRAVFKGIPHSSNLSPKSSSSSLSPPLSDDELEIHAEDLDVEFLPSKCHCPLCGEEVSRSFLEGLDSGVRHTSWKKRVDICAAHKRQAAESQLKEEQYPTIDWDDFDERLQQFHDQIEAILDLRKPSHYREELKKRVTRGKSRNAFRDPNAAGDMSLVPGYYGMRGAQRMQNHIVNNFSDRIRELAVTDKVIPATGATGYVQSVLVPELAVMLVRQDLGIDEEQARKTLSESAHIGKLVNAEVTERVERRHVESV